MIVVTEWQLAEQEYPPFSFIYWTTDAIKKALRLAGFDFTKPVLKITDGNGTRWEQRP